MGAHFKALNEAVLMALAKILENFFPFRVSQPLCVDATPKGLDGLVSIGQNVQPTMGLSFLWISLQFSNLSSCTLLGIFHQ